MRIARLISKDNNRGELTDARHRKWWCVVLRTPQQLHKAQGGDTFNNREVLASAKVVRWQTTTEEDGWMDGAASFSLQRLLSLNGPLCLLLRLSINTPRVRRSNSLELNAGRTRVRRMVPFQEEAEREWAPQQLCVRTISFARRVGIIV
jgi:hypothetical protein